MLGASEKAVDIVYYASKLADFVRKMVESGKDLSYEERQKQARKEWSRIKKREGLKHDPITTQAIVSAAAKAIAKTRE